MSTLTEEGRNTSPLTAHLELRILCPEAITAFPLVMHLLPWRTGSPLGVGAALPAAPVRDAELACWGWLQGLDLEVSRAEGPGRWQQRAFR